MVCCHAQKRSEAAMTRCFVYRLFSLLLSSNGVYALLCLKSRKKELVAHYFAHLSGSIDSNSP